MRLGLFGGSFDPIHLGHLLLAETCRETGRLDQVWFTPAAQPPHKIRRLAAAAHRLAMIELAVAGNPDFRTCELELQRGGVSFTVDTLEAIAQQEPQAELFLLLGADSLADLPSWRHPQRILELAKPLVVQRPGSQPDLGVLAGLLSTECLTEITHSIVMMPALEISSTDMRRRVAQGLSIRYRTTSAVEHYIRHHRLYTAVADEGANR